MYIIILILSALLGSLSIAGMVLSLKEKRGFMLTMLTWSTCIPALAMAVGFAVGAMEKLNI